MFLVKSKVVTIKKKKNTDNDGNVENMEKEWIWMLLTIHFLSQSDEGGQEASG